MLQNPRQLGCHGSKAADRDAELAIVNSSRPGRSAGHIEKGLFGVERNKNVVARWRAEVAREIVIVRFERGQNLPAECLRSLFALVMQDEMAALTLGEVGFDILLALRFCQILLNDRIGAQFESV